MELGSPGPAGPVSGVGMSSEEFENRQVSIVLIVGSQGLAILSRRGSI